MVEEEEFERVFNIFMRDVLGNWYEKLGREIYKIKGDHLIDGIIKVSNVNLKKPRTLRQLGIYVSSSSSIENYIMKDKRFEFIDKHGIDNLYIGIVDGTKMRLYVSDEGVHLELPSGTTPERTLEVLVEYVSELSIKHDQIINV
jgi:hypothetical protein